MYDKGSKKATVLKVSIAKVAYVISLKKVEFTENSSSSSPALIQLQDAQIKRQESKESLEAAGSG